MPTEINSTNTLEVIQINNKIRFERKANKPDVQDFRICAVEFLDNDQWQRFTNNMLDDYDFIAKHSQRLCVGSDEVTNALLIVNKQGEDGILVNSEGSAYARYSALLPNARSFIEQQMGRESKMTLWQLMSCGLEDVHLVDVDEEHDLATIVELNQGTLSVAGRSAWSDVLSAKVEGIYNGYYGTQIAVSGCDPQRLADFSFMLAGHCDAEDYDTWVNKHDQEQDIGPVLSM